MAARPRARYRLGVRLPIASALLLLAALGCGAEPAGPSDAGLDADVRSADGGGARADLGTEPPRLVAVSLDPATAELVAHDGARPSARFTVEGRYSDGSTRPLPGGRFAIDPHALGAIDAEGLFVADGRFGGRGTVEVQAEGFTARAEVRVKLESVVFMPGTSTDAAGRFEVPPTTDPARAPSLLYPPDGAVMPQNVYPADIQWESSVDGDLYRVRVEKPNATLEAYMVAEPGFRSGWQAEAEAWRRVAQTDPESPARFTVERLDRTSAERLVSASVEVRFARAALSGAVYYWDIVAGRIIRIDDGTAERRAFMPSPPLGCVGCHSVSTSGRYMAGRFGGGDNVASVFDLTRDLSADPPPLEFPIADSTRWWFSAWSPDDSRLVVSVREGGLGGRLAFVDPRSGSYVSPLEGTLPDVPATHPAWSPDGAEIAFVADVDDWGGNNTRGDIHTVAMLGADRVGAARRLVAGSQIPGAFPAGSAASYPSYSPDSSLIAFAHGNNSRSETGLSALYAIRRDGTNLVRLDRASGGPTGDTSFQPRFSPFEQGGYYWLSFLSRRDYGNAPAGTRGSGRQQIWVTAIKVDAQPGEDPSEVAYWLPGQDTRSLNISAYWAPRPCREGGAPCSVGAECCSEVCNVDTGGGGACTDPPGYSECASFGQACRTSASCCDSLECAGGVCGGF